MPAEGAMPHRVHRGSISLCSLKILSYLLLIAILGAGFSGCDAGKDSTTLTVYTYDSFIAEWGAAPKIAEAFKAKTGISLTFVAKGDGGALLAALIAEKRSRACDVVIGIDNQVMPKALAASILGAYKPAGLDAIPQELRIDSTNRLQPFDYGHFAFIWDSQSTKTPPTSLADLTKPLYARSIILMDPRTSTPGLGLISWIKAVYGDDWEGYWRELRKSTLTMTPGWDAGYGLFTSGEAPLVLSYATSPAYHKETENSDRYRALLFPEGHPVQIEFAGIIADTKHRKNAERFMDFLLSEECQAILPATQWMYPALRGTPLPASFAAAPKPEKTLVLSLSGLEEDAQRAASIMDGSL
jgi:thiamine transport system substrate-binding protein